ncbi:hypothetical protein [Actinomadura terrae]|uniref:hypothetical protein n=1 Tax=Actinomadura terrae TaxID=604353 RepID=UPI001FA74162|nr:hypothetical protein [Actinomadura terrae]
MPKLAALVALAAALLLTGCETGTEPNAVQPAEAKGGKTSGKAKPKTVPVAIKAKRAAFRPGPLNDGGAFTCVKATVTNNTSKNLQVNPFFFELTDSGGEKRKASVGEAEGEFETMMLAPKEKASGLVCAEGRFAPKTITFTKDALGTNYRAQVA